MRKFCKYVLGASRTLFSLIQRLPGLFRTLFSLIQRPIRPPERYFPFIQRLLGSSRTFITIRQCLFLALWGVPGSSRTIQEAVRRLWNALASSGTLRFETQTEDPRGVRGALEDCRILRDASGLRWNTPGQGNLPIAFADQSSFGPRLSW